jgi:hypothetical protein
VGRPDLTFRPHSIVSRKGVRKSPAGEGGARPIEVAINSSDGCAPQRGKLAVPRQPLKLVGDIQELFSHCVPVGGRGEPSALRRHFPQLTRTRRHRGFPLY